jgi:predicted lipoprotein with Yx(FWY)xxD motif
VVNAQGHTLYALSPETATHLLCKSNECLKFWPPLTVSSTAITLKDGAGVHGHLAILRRRNGLLQVTLRGMPLYRFSRDHAKGQANGEGIESFGGTWHAVVATTRKPSAPSAPAPASTPMTPLPGY